MEYIGSGLRNTLIFCSLLVLTGGAAIVSTAVWVVITIGSFQNLVGAYAGIFVAVYIMLGMGALMFIMAFFGCAGALLESKKMLLAYCGLLIVVFLIQAVGSVLAFVYYPLARDAAQATMVDYDNIPSIAQGWDTIQGVLECCGLYSYTDWRVRPAYPTLPPSCCSDKVDSCSETGTTRFILGCDPSIAAYFRVIGGIGFGVLGVELFTIIILGCVFRALMK